MKSVMIQYTGCKCWWLNERLHREDGPAIEYADGSKWWYINGQLHRTDGPALDDGNFKLWYYQGTKIDCKSQFEFERYLRLKAFW